jgi:hypothetical protein
VLSKEQIIPLLRCLDRAGKWLQSGHLDRAVVMLEAFAYEMERLVSEEELTFYVGLDLAARAEALVDSLAD